MEKNRKLTLLILQLTLENDSWNIAERTIDQSKIEKS